MGEKRHRWWPGDVRGGKSEAAWKLSGRSSSDRLERGGEKVKVESGLTEFPAQERTDDGCVLVAKITSLSGRQRSLRVCLWDSPALGYAVRT